MRAAWCETETEGEDHEHADGVDACTGPVSSGPVGVWLVQRAGRTVCAVNGVDHDRSQVLALMQALFERVALMPG